MTPLITFNMSHWMQFSLNYRICVHLNLLYIKEQQPLLPQEPLSLSKRCCINFKNIQNIKMFLFFTYVICLILRYYSVEAHRSDDLRIELFEFCQRSTAEENPTHCQVNQENGTKTIKVV